jgi:hypothetical protein
MGKTCALLIRSRWAPVACLVGLTTLALLPLDGFGVPLCAFKFMTGLPCPGCGLTRSLIHLAHGDVGGAAVMNPVGLVLFPVLAALALLVFIPRARREPLAAWFERRPSAANATTTAVGVMLVVNGVARILWIAGFHHPSIW